MSLINFNKCTLAAYNALETKDTNALYIITDKKFLFIGDSKYTGSVEFVSTLDGVTGVFNTIYVVNNGAGGVSYYDGTSFLPMFKPVVNTITTEATGANIPSDKAVVDYVISAITSGISISMPIDDASTTATDKSWSANKLYTELGNIQSALSAITGE